MEKRSVLKKLVVLLLIVIMLPAVMPAIEPTCMPGECSECSNGDWDCTVAWTYASNYNMWIYMVMSAMGIPVVVCCDSH